MSRTFDYKSADVSTIAEHFLVVQKQSYFRLTKYYKDEPKMVAKLTQARDLANVLRLQAAYEESYKAVK